MTHNHPTLQIIANISRRGWFDGWTPGQLLGRQAVKLAEEACELLGAMPLPQTQEVAELLRLAEETRRAAKAIFKDKNQWRGYDVQPCQITPSALAELADVKVTLASFVYWLAETAGKHRRYFWADAVKKSADDVKRGASYK